MSVCVHLIVDKQLVVESATQKCYDLQAQSNWKSMLAYEAQWSDGSDLYILESVDDPYAHYEAVLIKYITSCKWETF